MQQIAHDLAGYTLAEADLLRRAMGKKIKAEMDAAARPLPQGRDRARHRPRIPATTIFDACAKFAEYGFNKSHSAPYAFITYQTAWMKANYPVEFMAASLTLETGNTDKIAEFRREAMRLGITVEPPSVNRSGVEFDVTEGRILYSLAAVKGVGAQAVEHLVEARGRAAVPRPRRLRPAHQSEDHQQAGAGKPRRRRRPRRTDARPGAASMPASTASSAMPRGSRTAPRAARPDMFGAALAAEPILPAGGRAVARGRETAARARRGRLLSLRPSARRVWRGPAEDAGPDLGGVHRVGPRAGATAGRLAGTVTARQERRMRTGNRMARGAALRSDGLL